MSISLSLVSLMYLDLILPFPPVEAEGNAILTLRSLEKEYEEELGSPLPHVFQFRSR